MGRVQAMIYAGIGCRRGCSAQDVLAVLRLCAEAAAAPLTALAAPDFKCNETGIRTAAASLGLGVIAIAPVDMAAAQPRCITHSRVAQAATGLGSVAEAAALAAAGPGGVLLQPRLAYGGATCALARSSAA